MIVSDQHKFVFVEIPHTGSHSVSNELTELYGGRAIVRKHANITQYMAWAKGEQKRYYKFATVRNPLDYMATMYEKYRSNHKGQYTNEEALLKNGGHVTNEHLRHFDYVYNQGGSFEGFMKTFFDKVYNNWFLVGSHQFDYVMKFENLQSEFADVLKLIGVEKVRDIPHINPTKGKRPYQEYYTEGLKDLVLRNYGPFMKKWGYEFPLGWQASEIPVVSDFKFRLKGSLVDRAASLIKLDPDSVVVSRCKKLVDAVI